jgi:hypothetical protein
MRRDGAFPPSQQISPNRVGWPVYVIEAHLVPQNKTDPADLSDDALEASALDLAAVHLSRSLGQPIQPSAVRVATDEEQAAELQRRLDHWEGAFANLDWPPQIAVAGWLFSELRNGFTAALQTPGVTVRASDAEWRNM